MDFKTLFPNKALIGMIHLAGEKPITRGIEEVLLLEKEGFSGALIENYHGELFDVIKTLEELEQMKLKIKIGVNVLPNNYVEAFDLAQRFGANFIQLDYISGNYIHTPNFDSETYLKIKNESPNICVLGGVWPKYYTPKIETESQLKKDLYEAKKLCDAIVVTGEGTGKETPIHKINQFKEELKEFPLLVGAGVTPENISQQLINTNGAIIGSSLKKGNDTRNPIDEKLVRNVRSQENSEIYKVEICKWKLMNK